MTQRQTHLSRVNAHQFKANLHSKAILPEFVCCEHAKNAMTIIINYLCHKLHQGNHELGNRDSLPHHDLQN